MFMKNAWKLALKIGALMVVVPVTVLAQSSLDEEVNAELDRMYQSQSAGRRQTPSVQVNVQAQPTVSTTQNQLNDQATSQGSSQRQGQGQNQNQAQVQKQPVTVIEATPLSESNAEKMRKTRQDAELTTEQKIVEKLEQSRLDDEKRRAEVLFGDKFNTMVNQGQANQQQASQVVIGTQQQSQQQQQAVVPVVVPEQMVTAPVAPVAAPAPVVVATPIAPAPIETAPPAGLDRESIRGEVSAALAEFKKDDEKPKSKSYFSVSAGSGDYPDAVNVKPQYSFGLGFGQKFNDKIVAEASFLYSNYQVEQRFDPYSGNGATICNPYCTNYPRITEMNQYASAVLVKYQFLNGMLRPELGTLASYTYRTFTDKQFALSDAAVSSHALDLGLMMGASVELSESFSLGLDYRYMWNMTNKVDGSGLQRSSLQQSANNDTPIEGINYYNLSIVGRATF
jgi:hypothetical protein